MSRDDEPASASFPSLTSGDLLDPESPPRGAAEDPSHQRPPLVVVAWCPEEETDAQAVAYEGKSAREVAQQHAEHLFYRQAPADWSECYEVRVRATRGDRVREWDVCVDVDIEASFYASVAFRVPREKEAACSNPRAEASGVGAEPRGEASAGSPCDA